MKALLISIALVGSATALASAPMCHPSKAPTYLIPSSVEWQAFYGGLK